MTNANKTFSSLDIVRIWKDHLDVKERSDIICFFTILGRIDDIMDKSAAFDIIGFLIGQIPRIGAVLSFFLSIDEQMRDTIKQVPCQKEFRRLARQAGIRRTDIP